MNKVFGDSSSSDAAFFSKQSGFKPRADSSKMSNKQVRFKRRSVTIVPKKAILKKDAGRNRFT
jgi:hypothetical protein